MNRLNEVAAMITHPVPTIIPSAMPSSSPGMPPTTQISAWGGHLHRVPAPVVYPSQATSRVIWDLYFYGDSTTPPYCSLRSVDILNYGKIKTYVSRAKTVIRTIILCAWDHNLSASAPANYKTFNQNQMDAHIQRSTRADADDVYNAGLGNFLKALYGRDNYDTHINNKYTTLYNVLEKYNKENPLTPLKKSA